MKLMSDLISYLRDLLVGKVKPEALADDLNPELQKSLETQAAMIETDRLLELIDQFAAAEGRMKWAPNKRLHFEVAVIKAIQTLSQVTLNEVIENLAALRDGQTSDATAEPPCRNAPETLSRRSPEQSETPRAAEQAAANHGRPGRTHRSPTSFQLDHEAVWRKAVEQVRSAAPVDQSLGGSCHSLGNRRTIFHCRVSARSRRRRWNRSPSRGRASFLKR